MRGRHSHVMKSCDTGRPSTQPDPIMGMGARNNLVACMCAALTQLLFQLEVERDINGTPWCRCKLGFHTNQQLSTGASENRP